MKETITAFALVLGIVVFTSLYRYRKGYKKPRVIVHNPKKHYHGDGNGKCINCYLPIDLHDHAGKCIITRDLIYESNMYTAGNDWLEKDRVI